MFKFRFCSQNLMILDLDEAKNGDNAAHWRPAGLRD